MRDRKVVEIVRILHSDWGLREVDKELHSASAAGDLDKVQDALNRGAAIESRDKDDNTAFMVAILKRRYKLVTFFQEQGCGLGPSVEVAGRRAKSRAKLSEDEKESLDEEVIEELDGPYKGAELVERVKSILNQGGDINCRGGLPLIQALRRGQIDISLYLLARGASVTAVAEVIYSRQPQPQLQLATMRYVDRMGGLPSTRPAAGCSGGRARRRWRRSRSWLSSLLLQMSTMRTGTARLRFCWRLIVTTGLLLLPCSTFQTLTGLARQSLAAVFSAGQGQIGFCTFENS